jgi:hypothetical protein
LKRMRSFRNLILSPNIVRMMKSRTIRWAGHVACIWEVINAYEILIRITECRLVGGPTQPPIQRIPGTLSPGSKAVGAWSWPLPPSGAEFKNAWSYTSTPPYVFIAWCLIKHRKKFKLKSVTEGKRKLGRLRHRYEGVKWWRGLDSFGSG